MLNMKRLLVALMIIAATIAIWWFVPPARLVVEKTHTPYAAAAGPLRVALDSGASDVEFEKLVMGNPDWISHHERGGAFDWPVLADCALLKRTNYVRILLRHGADAKAAIEFLKEVGSDDGIALIGQVKSEQGSKLDP